MKVKTLALAAGLGSLLLAGTANAGLSGWSVELHNQWTNNVTGLNYDVYRVYAITANPETNVTGIINEPSLGLGTNIGTKSGNPFFRSTMFGDPAPVRAIAGGGTYTFVNGGGAGDPIGGLDNTSYFTLNLANGFPDPPGDGSLLTPGSTMVPEFAAGLASGKIDWTPDSGALVVVPGDPQGFGDADGRVLLFQLTVAEGDGFTGHINVSWANTAQGTTGLETFQIFSQVPAPGALALLGLAGLVGVRRRRA
jgi:MYXO-CTERM domain-containing protein